MHIETHAKETDQMMMDLLFVINKFQVAGELDITKLTVNDINDLTESFEKLSAHLFNYEGK